MLKWTLRSTSTSDCHATSTTVSISSIGTTTNTTTTASTSCLTTTTSCLTSSTCTSLHPDAQYTVSPLEVKFNLKDSNKCWSENQVKVAQVKSTLKIFTKENGDDALITENQVFMDSISNHSNSKSTTSATRTLSTISSSDSKDDKRRKRHHRIVKCTGLDPLRLFSDEVTDSDSGSVYMRLEHTPVALLRPYGTGNQDPRRRPLIDLSNGDYTDVHKHLQYVYLRHPHLPQRRQEGGPVKADLLTADQNGGDDTNKLTSEEALLLSCDKQPEAGRDIIYDKLSVEDNKSFEAAFEATTEEGPRLERSDQDRVESQETGASVDQGGPISFEKAMHQHHMLQRKHQQTREGRSSDEAPSTQHSSSPSVPRGSSYMGDQTTESDVRRGARPEPLGASGSTNDIAGLVASGRKHNGDVDVVVTADSNKIKCRKTSPFVTPTVRSLSLYSSRQTSCLVSLSASSPSGSSIISKRSVRSDRKGSGRGDDWSSARSGLRRGAPEGESQSGLNTLREVNQRHSIAAIPRESPDSRQRRYRGSSNDRVREPSRDRLLVDIRLSEPLPAPQRRLRTPEKSPRNSKCNRKIKDKKTRKESMEATPKKEMKRQTEPIYERLKGSSFDSSRGASVYDNALYMTMKDSDTPCEGNETHLLDLYKETHSIYSIPKASDSILMDLTSSSFQDNLYENMLYLPMSDVTKSSVHPNKNNQRRPLPPPPVGDALTSQVHGTTSAILENVTSAIPGKKSPAKSVSQHMHSKCETTSKKEQTPSTDGTRVCSKTMNILQSALKELRSFKKASRTTGQHVRAALQRPDEVLTRQVQRPLLPLPPSPSHSSVGSQTECAVVGGSQSKNQITCQFATTCKINRTDIIRQSKIRHNMRMEQQAGTDDRTIDWSFHSDSSEAGSSPCIQYFSDNLDSGVSEGVTTPLMSPSSAPRSPSGAYHSPSNEPSSPPYTSCSLSSASSNPSEFPLSDSLLGEPCTPLSMQDLALSKAKSLEELENDYFFRVPRHNLYENISHDVTDPRFLESLLTMKQLQQQASQSETMSVLFTPQISAVNYRDVSKMLHSAVGRNLFAEFSDVSAVTCIVRPYFEQTLISPMRRHSISGLEDISRRIVNQNNEKETSFWRSIDGSLSLELPAIRKSLSLSSIADVPLITSVSEILKDPEDRRHLRNNKRYAHWPLSQDTKVVEGESSKKATCVALNGTGNTSGGFVGLVGEQGVGVTIDRSVEAGNQANTSQWFEEPSRDHRFLRTPGKMTLQLPELQQQGTTRMAGGGASVPQRTPRRVDVPQDHVLSPTRPHGCQSHTSPLSKLTEKQLQRQEESSYRLLKLFQECPLDCIVESEDDEWDSGEWSMHATLDENSSRDPALLETSAFNSSPESLVKTIVSSECELSQSVNEKLQSDPDDKMLAKFRKSFRSKKNTSEPKMGVFMFVDNPMYLSPEVKKEAKVISSVCGNSNWYCNNPTYSSPELVRNRVRTYTKVQNDTFQCEKENIKNLLCLAQHATEHPLQSQCIIASPMLQCNPCYESPSLRIRPRPISYRRDVNYLEPIDVNLPNSRVPPVTGVPQPSSATQILTEPSNRSARPIDMDKFLEHEYCTIPGDEESDSWITQSSGSQQPGSPAARRLLPFEESESFSCEARRKEATIPSRIWRENSKSNHLYNNIHGQHQLPGSGPGGMVSSDRLARASPRTPRAVKRSSRLRDQAPSSNSPPTIPPPLPSRLREQWRHRAVPNPEGNARPNSSSSGVSEPIAFQLPPDGVYESISQVNSRLKHPVVDQKIDNIISSYKVIQNSKNSVSSLHKHVLQATVRGRLPSNYNENTAVSNQPLRPPRSENLAPGRPALLPRTSTAPRTPKTPSRRCSRLGAPSIATPRTAKNGLTSLGRGRCTPSHRPHSKYRARDVLQGKGLLHLEVYESAGLLTIHILEASKLRSPSSSVCNPYVKVSLVPDALERTFCRTPVQRATNSPVFRQHFSFDFLKEDLEKRLLISLWSRDTIRKRSEFLGCMSFNVAHIVSKKVHGWFRLLTEAVGRRKHFAAPPLTCPADDGGNKMEDCREGSPAGMGGPRTSPRRHNQVTAAGLTEGSGEEGWSSNSSGSNPHPTPPPPHHLPHPGQTPYTLSITFARGPRGFGFSVTWTRPPRVERVEAEGAAAWAGLLPGDYIIFVGERNIVRMHESDVMAAIRDSGDHLSLEVYRKGVTLTPGPLPAVSRRSLVTSSQVLPSQPHLTSSQLTVHQLPQFQSKPFSSHQPPNRALNRPSNNVSGPHYAVASRTLPFPLTLSSPSRRFSAPQQNTLGPPFHLQHPARRKLVLSERRFAATGRCGLERFLIPLTFRQDLLTEEQHATLFTSIEELVCTTEAVVERLEQQMPDPEGDGTIVRPVGVAYHPLLDSLLSQYRRQLESRHRADRILASKLTEETFKRFLAACQDPPPVLDITSFLHLPAQHLREVLALLQELAGALQDRPQEDPLLDTALQAFRTVYHEVTSQHNIMEPGLPPPSSPHSPGRRPLRIPLLSVADIAARLVFTKFAQPFTLDNGRRRWVFGGELCMFEGRQLRQYWVLLFTDLILFTVSNRDRVIYVVEEPVPLRAVLHAVFEHKKKDTEFRLIIDRSLVAPRPLSISASSLHPPKASWGRFGSGRARRRTLVIRAPSVEHKATWSNLLQRQIQACRSATPSPAPFTPPCLGSLDRGSLARAASLDGLHSLRFAGPATHAVHQTKSSSIGDLTDTPRAVASEDEFILELDDGLTEFPVRAEGETYSIDGGHHRAPFVRNNSSTSSQSALSLSNNQSEDSLCKTVSFSVQQHQEVATEHNCSMRGCEEDNNPKDEFEEPIPYERVKTEPKKKGISSRFKAKLFPGKQLPKKRVNSIKKVEKYVNSLSVNPDQVEHRSVTPVFDREDDLKTDDFIRKRSEFLKLKSTNFVDGVHEIVLLDIPESQDDHIEAAMERRQALLRYREEKKNSLKLEGILEESPQSSPKHGVTLPTPEDYEDYLDAEVEHDYPELAGTPAGLESCFQEPTGGPPDEEERPRHYSDGRPGCLTASSSMVFMDEPSPTGGVGVVELRALEVARSRNAALEYLRSGYNNPSSFSASSSSRVRSLSDSHDYSSSSHNPNSTSTLKSIRSISSYESHTYSPGDTDYSNELPNRDSVTRCSISSTSGYSSISFDSSSAINKKKKATLFLPTITTSLPEISLQPPTPQAPKPKPNYETESKVKYDIKVPGYRSMFLTVPGSEDDDNDRFLPGCCEDNDEQSSESSVSSSDDDDIVHKPRALSGMSTLSSQAGGLRRFGSSCDISSLGLTVPSLLGADGGERGELVQGENLGNGHDSYDGEEYDGEVNDNDGSITGDTQGYDEHGSVTNNSHYDDNEEYNSQQESTNGIADLRQNNNPHFCLTIGKQSESFDSYDSCTDVINANNSFQVPNLRSKIGGTGTGTFVASKLEVFEKVAEEEHRKYIECQAVRNRVQRAPRMSGDYIEKFYGPRVIQNIAARATDGMYCGDYASDSEGYETNSEGQSTRRTVTPPSSGRRSPSNNKNQNMDLLNRMNQNVPSTPSLIKSTQYSQPRPNTHLSITTSSQNLQQLSEVEVHPLPSVHSRWGQGAPCPVPRIRLDSSVDEQHEIEEDDDGSIQYNDRVDEFGTWRQVCGRQQDCRGGALSPSPRSAYPTAVPVPASASLAACLYPTSVPVPACASPASCLKSSIGKLREAL